MFGKNLYKKHGFKKRCPRCGGKVNITTEKVSGVAGNQTHITIIAKCENWTGNTLGAGPGASFQDNGCYWARVQERK